MPEPRTYAPRSMRVVVTGSSGLIGRNLCSLLAGNGHDVVRVVRREVRPGEQALQWDPEAGTIDVRGLEDADAVVHLAGAGIGDRRWSDSRKRVLVESRTRSTAVLAGALAGLDPRPEVLVSGSAIGIYGDRGDEILTEKSPPRRRLPGIALRALGGRNCPRRRGRCQGCCARTGVVLSAQGGALPKMLPLFKVGLGGRFGSGAQWWSWITLDDEIRAIEWLLEHDVRGPVNLTAPTPVTNREFTAVLSGVLCDRLGCPCPGWARGCCSEPSSPTRCCSRVPGCDPRSSNRADSPFPATTWRQVYGAGSGGPRRRSGATAQRS